MIPRRATPTAWMTAACLLAATGGTVSGQASDRAGAGLERDQQSAEFALRLQQSQQALALERLRPDDVELRQEMDTLHLQQRHRLETLGAAQRLELQLRRSASGSAGIPPSRLQLERDRRMELDRADHELADQLRRAEREKARAETPRWSPTLDP